MASIRRHRNQSNNLRPVHPVCFFAFPQPVLDSLSVLPVDSVRWIHVYSAELPGLSKTVVLWKRVLDLSIHNGVAVRAWIELNAPPEAFPYGINILLGSASILVVRHDFSSCSHSECTVVQFFLRNCESSASSVFIVPLGGPMMLNHFSMRSALSLK